MPEQTAIVGADDEVVTAWVDVDGGDPAGAGLDDLDEFLALQIVAADHALGGDEEDRPGRMELRGLGEAGKAAEGDLAQVFGEGVDGDGAALAGGGDGGEEVAAAVPVDGFDVGADGELEQHAESLKLGAGSGPFRGRFFLDAVGGDRLSSVGGVAETSV